MLRQVLQDLLAQRLDLGMPALALGLDCRRKQEFRLLPRLFLQPCVLEGARADTALQTLFLVAS